MRLLLIPLFAALAFPNVLHSSHLDNQKELVVTSESTKESIELAKYLKTNGVIKYPAGGCMRGTQEITYIFNH